MKKTRFFYGKNYFLSVLLCWLLLLDAAVQFNLGQAQEKDTKLEEKSGDEESSLAQEKPSGAAQAAQSEQTAVVPETPEPVLSENPSIRVLLMDSSYGTYYHPSVTVEICGETSAYDVDSPELADGPVILDGGEEGICISSIKRQKNPPVYQGKLEISKTSRGLLLINELPLESYLEAVVPSEMPASYEKEALMAQAVCARTYAKKQMEEGTLKEEYGADVDDSVNYQVYRNISPKEQTSEAVKETEGKVMCQEGELITAYYFSTSAGTTSTDEVWGAEEAAPYLKSVECDFDAEEPWSRWSVEIPWDTVNDRACSLDGCSGALLSLQIVKKSQSGAVTGLLVTTEGGSSELSQEYDIRRFLSPRGLTITEKDGTQTKGGALLPSAYFSLDANEGSSFLIQGAGYGHGVGMSQTAANEMAKEGYSCDEILHYFFKDIAIVTE